MSRRGEQSEIMRHAQSHRKFSRGFAVGVERFRRTVWTPMRYGVVSDAVPCPHISWISARDLTELSLPCIDHGHWRSFFPTRAWGRRSGWSGVPGRGLPGLGRSKGWQKPQWQWCRRQQRRRYRPWLLLRAVWPVRCLVPPSASWWRCSDLRGWQQCRQQA